MSRNRLYPQVTTSQFMAASLALSLTLLFALPHWRPLGLAIVGWNLLLYGWFSWTSRDVLVDDSKFSAALEADNSRFLLILRYIVVGAFASVVSLIVIEFQDVKGVFVLTLMMGILTSITVTENLRRVINDAGSSSLAHRGCAMNCATEDTTQTRF